MENRKIRFYFAYNSPYSFLANTRVDEQLGPLGAELEYKPVYSPRTVGAPGPDRVRIQYLLEDVGRFAEAYGLTLHPGSMADTRNACLGFFFAQTKEKGNRYHDAVYRARFLEGRDIGQGETLAEIAEAAGLDRTEFLASLEDPRYAAALEASNKDATADEVFGFPFFIFDGKRFWGNDRIEWLVRELKKD